MSLLDLVSARLEARIPELAGRVYNAGDFARLMKEGILPPVPVSAHVLPLGLQGGAGDAISGLFRQSLDETVGVVLTLKTTDPSGARVLASIDALIRQTIDCLAGWGPAEAIGVFHLARGTLLSVVGGAISYQLDFTLPDQLRIPDA